MAQRPRRSDERMHWPIIDSHDIKMPPPRQRDRLLDVLSALTVLTWLLIIGFLLLVAYAKPDSANLFSRLLSQAVNDRSWSYDVLRTASFMLNAAFLLCLAGLFLSTRRGKKAVWKRQRMFYVLGTVSLAGSIVAWMLFF